MPAKQQKRRAALLFSLLAFIFLPALSPLIAHPGDPDASFEFPPDLLKGMTIMLPLADGRIVLGSTYSLRMSGPRSSILRVDANKRLDPGFDTLSLPLERLFRLRDYGQGKILVIANFTNGVAASRLARLNADGTLDASFKPEMLPDEKVGVATAGPDGKVVAYANVFGGENQSSRIVRLNADGSLDRAFTPARVGMGDIEEILVMKDGSFYVAGTVDRINGQPRAGVARLNADGSLDEGFAKRPAPTTEGIVFFTTVKAIGIGPEGKVYLGGGFGRMDGKPQRYVARLNLDGSLDPGFKPPLLDRDVSGVFPQTDGKVIVTGSFTRAGTSFRPHVARLEANGELDEGYLLARPVSGISQVAAQPDGQVLVWANVPVTNRGPSEVLWRLEGGVHRLGAPAQAKAPQSQTRSEGQTVTFTVGARAVPPASYQWQFNGKDLPGETNAVLALKDLTYSHMGSYAVSISNQLGAIFSGAAHLIVNARPITPGSVDMAFDARKTFGGRVTTLQLDGDGILAGGTPKPDQFFTSIFARLHTDGTRDEAFASGVVTGGRITCSALDPQGGIYVGGDFRRYNNQFAPGLVRLKHDGQLDGTFRSALTNLAHPECLLPLPGGKILAGGEFLRAEDLPERNVQYLLRLNPDGSLDDSFRLDPALAGLLVNALAPHGPDLILVGGAMGDGVDRSGTLARIRNDGSRDAGFPLVTKLGHGVRSLSFGKDGGVLAGLAGTFKPPGANRPTSIVAIGPKGDVKAAFPSVFGMNDQVLPLRDGKYLSAGAGFLQRAGLGETNLARPLTRHDGQIRALMELPNGDWLTGGDFSQVNGVPRPAIARLFSREQTPEPVLFGPFHTREGFRLSLPTVAGKKYHLEYKDSLAEPAWKPLGTVAGNGAWQDATDATPPGRSRFYQIRIE